MSAPRVSAVIPSYNRAASIRAAVESALAQSFTDLEVIVVDDGSDDDTASALAGLADPRLIVLRHERNAGAAAARNTGIRAARGDLIAFLDSDDAWMPEKLALQVAALDAAPADHEVCCTGVMLHLLDHGVTRVRRIAQSANWSHTLAIGCDLSPGTTLLARRAAFDRVGPMDETLPRFEDWDWLFRYTRTHQIVALSQPLAHVYNRRGRLGDQVEASTRRFLAKHEPALAALPRHVRDTAVTDAWLQVVAAYAFERRFGRAVRPFLRALRRQPIKCILRGVRGAFYVARGRLIARPAAA
ncbi:MAG: glycosyltransferase family 2 protein [Hyphomonadaceae bacterium]